ncbi:MAG: helix-turn-helix transcriptional regulator [Erysipelotrichaceae bacterium]|nr:helix-turn-helix transcriptional regulator [Erysipelotrichaceae bacterium]
MRLSEIIETYVKDKKITYRQLARDLGTSHTQVFLMLENESLPKVETMKKMSEIMNISMDEIKKAAYKEVDGEYKAFLTDEELRNRGIVTKKKKK